jgi:hypothetical protein
LSVKVVVDCWMGRLRGGGEAAPMWAIRREDSESDDPNASDEGPEKLFFLEIAISGIFCEVLVEDPEPGRCRADGGLCGAEREDGRPRTGAWSMFWARSPSAALCTLRAAGTWARRGEAGARGKEAAEVEVGSAL